LSELNKLCLYIQPVVKTCFLYVSGTLLLPPKLRLCQLNNHGGKLIDIIIHELVVLTNSFVYILPCATKLHFPSRSVAHDMTFKRRTRNV